MTFQGASIQSAISLLTVLDKLPVRIVDHVRFQNFVPAGVFSIAGLCAACRRESCPHVGFGDNLYCQQRLGMFARWTLSVDQGILLGNNLDLTKTQTLALAVLITCRFHVHLYSDYSKVAVQTILSLITTLLAP